VSSDAFRGAIYRIYRPQIQGEAKKGRNLFNYLRKEKVVCGRMLPNYLQFVFQFSSFL